MSESQISKPTELLPCPFCAGVAKLIHDTSSDYERQWRYTVYCQSLDCEMSGQERKTEAGAIAVWNRRTSPWTNFREQRPSDGESYEFLWVEHYGTKRREIGTFSDVDGWIWVGGNGINPREKKAVFYRELVEPPTPAEIEAAMKGEGK